MGAGPEDATPSVMEKKRKEAGVTEFHGQATGEWVQTVGRNRKPYRPPPRARRDSEILR